ncbi:hypothetical protein [Holdemania massiliensis]|uniref:Uncharacterized protein n=1 Tax=Holdemania massiliensis TaxID=1468449 RepID=A0A6N7S6I9_9FIRM|nr:hypothetical protein [Holdemania massiliensis]KAB3788146.1 hypothetical protein GAS64_22755 [Phocaeicola vulgatus]MSA70939.1 hypothetical protein [Holdemania massiliensis]MSA89265.1 hypothetical protein [Holdemania massiliensis]MSB78018.1 hypothetical protein [Holdemania massiliensis]MSC32943.1 hypothetical protein [Holdemania massiliensis]
MQKVPTDLMIEWCYFDAKDGKYKLKEGAPEQAKKDYEWFQSGGGIKPWKEAVKEQESEDKGTSAE